MIWDFLLTKTLAIITLMKNLFLSATIFSVIFGVIPFYYYLYVVFKVFKILRAEDVTNYTILKKPTNFRIFIFYSFPATFPSRYFRKHSKLFYDFLLKNKDDIKYKKEIKQLLFLNKILSIYSLAYIVFLVIGVLILKRI